MNNKHIYYLGVSVWKTHMQFFKITACETIN